MEAIEKLKITSAKTGRRMKDIACAAIMEWLAKNGGEK